MTDPHPTDVLILGAGASGLSAAHALSNTPHSLTLLESRDRIGGRIHTLHDPTWPLPLELGAEFVHGLPPSTWQILRDLKSLPPYDVTDNHHYLHRGTLTQKDFWSDIEKVLAKLDRLGAHDLSFADFLKRHAKSASPTARTMATNFVEGFNATHRALVSAQFLKRAQAAGDEIDELKAFRLPAGYDQVPAHLASSLDPDRATLHLSTTAHAVRWSKNSVEVLATAPNGQPRRYRAGALLVTLPLGVLQAPPGSPGAITFDPPLPPNHRRALSQMKMGPVVKLLARFREPFWESRDSLRDLAYLHAPDHPFPTCWTTLPMRTPVLTGWAGGPAADALANLPPAKVLDAFLSTLSASFRVPRRKLTPLLES